MILDSEAQRVLILGIIEAAPVQGQYPQAKKLVEALTELKEAAIKATIKEEKE